MPGQPAAGVKAPVTGTPSAALLQREEEAAYRQGFAAGERAQWRRDHVAAATVAPVAKPAVQDNAPAVAAPAVVMPIPAVEAATPPVPPATEPVPAAPQSSYMPRGTAKPVGTDP